MRDPGGSPEPREQPGYNGASAKRKSLAETSVEPQEQKERKRHLEAKPSENVAEQLVNALAAQRAANSSSEAGTRPAATPGQQDRTGRRSQPQTQPEPSEAGAADVLRPVADVRGPDRCAVVYKGSRRRGEFEVVVTENGASRRCVARSPEFRSPRFGAARRWGPARAAHELVVLRLTACGWWSVDSGGAWHELQFVRARPAGMRTRRSLVTVVREAGQARFMADEVDAYGNPTPLMVSTPFGAPRFLSVRPSRQARRSLEQLLGRMEAEGWEVAAPVGKNWYAISLWRPVSTNGDPHGPRSHQGRPAPDPA
jgi:hypothetical protein